LPAQTGGTTHDLTASFVPESSSIIFQDGFESGSFSSWWWMDGSPSVVSSPVYSGAHAAKATGPQSYWDKNLGSGYSDLFFAGYMQISALPPNDQVILFLDIYDASYSNIVAGGLYAAGSGSNYWLLFVNGNWFLSSTPANMQTNHWYFMEIEYNTGGTANFWVDNTLVASATGQSLLSNAQHVQAGNPGVTPAGFISYGDNYTVANGYITGGGQPPLTYGLTVNAYDNFGSQVTTTISIDGSAVGATGGTFSVSPGDHTLQVSAPNGYTFYNFTYNSNTNPANPATIPVTSTMTVTANYIRTSSTIFQDSFESGNFNAWSGTATGSGDTVQVVSSPVQDGQYAAHATTSAGGHNANVYYNIAPGLSTVDTMLYVNYATYNSNTQPVLVMYQTANGAGNIAYIRISYYSPTSAVLQIVDYANSQIYTSAPFAFSTNTWYSVEMRITIGSSTGSIQGLLNGALTINVDNVNTGTSNIGRISVGCPFSWGADNLYFDSVNISNS
jgi:hypothetical protein